jgi:hypothetical protein
MRLMMKMRCDSPDLPSFLSFSTVDTKLLPCYALALNGLKRDSYAFVFVCINFLDTTSAPLSLVILT